MEFLGYIIENGTITPSPGKVKALVNYPAPRIRKQIQRFLGLAGYFRKFIEGYASIARPLSDQLKKQARFTFGVLQEQAFLALKKALTEAPLLRV